MTFPWTATDNATGTQVVIPFDEIPPPAWYNARAYAERELTKRIGTPPREGFRMFDGDGGCVWSPRGAPAEEGDTDVL